VTPAQAIVAATRNGAAAARGLKDLGTLEAGQLADLVVLAADPLRDIKNLRSVAAAYKEGRPADQSRLPEVRVLSAIVVQ
jgi:imidazolonepropionase-like amidohydrolase